MKHTETVGDDVMMNNLRDCWKATKSNARSVLEPFGIKDDGSIIVLTLLLFVIMLVLGGMAVDFMHFETRRVALQSVTDRSVLAAAKLTQQEMPADVVEEYFEKAGYDPSIVTTDVLVDTASERTIEVAAEFELGTYFLHYVGIDQLAAPAFASASEGVNLVEVSLVLDYSLSMTGGGSTGSVSEFGTGRGRIGDLQDATKAFATELLQPQYDGRFSINIVPYGGHVNPGPVMFEYLNGATREAVYIEDASFNLGSDQSFDLSNTVFWANFASEGFPGEHVYIGADGVFGFNPLTGLNDDIVLRDNPLDETTRLSGVDGILGTDDDLTSWTRDALPDDIFGPDGVYGTSDDDQIDFVTFDNLDGIVFDDGETPADLDQDLLDAIQASDGVTLDGVVVHLNNDNAARVAFRYDIPYHCLEIQASDYNQSGLPSANQEQMSLFSIYNHLQEWRLQRQVAGFGWCPGDNTQIQYGVQNVDDVTDFVSTITTYHGTGTDAGMKWGLALLDPSSRPAFEELYNNGLLPEASRGRPADWKDQKTNKIIILMTDGAITSQIRPHDPDLTPRLTARSNGNLSSNLYPRATARSQLQSLCDRAKLDHGVEIYTVAFEVNSNNEADMRDCATNEEDYFFAASGQGLVEAFEDIAQQITALRLTQ